jgi:hypothetical protein
MSSLPPPWPELSNDPEFPSGIDLSSIVPYFTSTSAPIDPQSYSSALDKLSDLKTFLTSEKSLISRTDSASRLAVRTSRVLREEIANAKSAGISKDLIDQLSKIIRFLQGRSDCGVGPNLNGFSGGNPRLLRALENALQEQQAILTTLPRSLSTTFSDQQFKFLRDTVDLAIAARTQSHPYFERLPEEEILYRIFDAPASPLTKAHLIPFALDGTFESVSAWIESAVSVLAKYEGTGTFERRLVIYLFVTRFLFDRTFPQFDLRSAVDPVILGKMAAIATTVEHVRVDQAAIDWMNESLFVTNPIDASFCLHMVMKALEMPSPGDDADAYFSAMAEYSISSEVIVAVLVRSVCANPRAFVDYLEHWSRLTGFSGRCMAAIAFFGNAVDAIDEFVAQ